MYHIQHTHTPIKKLSNEIKWWWRMKNIYLMMFLIMSNEFEWCSIRWKQKKKYPAVDLYVCCGDIFYSILKTKLNTVFLFSHIFLNNKLHLLVNCYCSYSLSLDLFFSNHQWMNWIIFFSFWLAFGNQKQKMLAFDLIE